MAYIDRRHERNRPAIIATVAVLHGLAIYAIVTGLAYKFVPEIIVPFTARNTPAEPLPPPPEPQPSAKPAADPLIKAPLPKMPLAPPDHTIVADPAMPIPAPLPDANPGPAFVPDLPKPSPTFVPRAVRPTGNPGSWITTNDYPARDLREGNQGLARFSLVIGTDGKVESCVITQSTGSGGLDDATCRNVTRRARFDAATDESGAKVPGSYSGSVRWVIPRN